MQSSDRLIELVEKLSSLIPEGSQEFKDDVKNNIKVLLEDYLRKLKLVSREEFDIQKEVLLKTRLKIEELEKKLNN
ncbi:MAG: hypothetical protein CMD49_00305 [Gammaproteobacteria bacterium]|nr:hypothetical protein [Gammaproteobacteria bacterium]|tara:strand:+ start:299 stop:526 length:228 start_codon:yes stop_codon:yes gene_type:complete